MEQQPLVSCLCITHNRPEKLRRAIACFSAQTHLHKELLILFEDGDTATHSLLLEHRGAPGIRPHALPAACPLTLGEKRNLSIELARGEYFCLWDDDDWYHPRRVETQLSAARTHHKDASLLTHLLLFHVQTGQAYLSQMRLWEGSLLCRKSALNARLRYEPVALVEDSAFINSLVAANLVYPLCAPNMYVYERHGSNTSGVRLSELMFELAQRLSARNSQTIADLMASHSPQAAAEYMSSADLLSELDYFHGMKANLPSEKLERLRRYLDGDHTAGSPTTLEKP